MKKKSTQYITRKFKGYPPLAYDSPIIKEDFPEFHFVHYPENKGTFIAFSKGRNSEMFFCKCSKQSVINLFEISSKFSIEIKYAPGLSGGTFPFQNSTSKIQEIGNVITRKAYPFPKSISNTVDYSSTAVEEIEFKANLCHKCNQLIPQMRWSTLRKDNNFKQHFGWYIKQKELELGKWGNYILPEVCPDELIELLKIRKAADSKLHKAISQGVERLEKNALMKDHAQKSRNVDYYIENIVREEFGYKKVGREWKNENKLLELVTKLYPNEEVLYNKRPEWLKGLEIDVYVPAKKLAFEYHGIQHFEAVEFFGGKKAFKRRKAKDQLKRDRCKEQGVKLIEITHEEELSIDLIKSKINSSSIT